MSNPMLNWYEADTLDQVAAKITLDPLYESASDLTFRDADGAWWRPQRDGSWIHHEEGWKRAERPDSLEGAASLPVDAATTRHDLDEPAEPASPVDPVTDLEQVIKSICDLYRSGGMVSTMAELALSDRKLLGDDGSLWTAGAQSGSWYQYEDEAWNQVGMKPEGSFLAGEDAIAAAEAEGSALQVWAEKGPLLPEAITARWNPPSPPEALVEQVSDEVPVAPEPPPPPPAPIWQPSYLVPEGGMQSWAQPDPSTAAITDLHAGTPLKLVARNADWAQVRAENGWEGWVDGRRLVPVAPPAPSAPPPPAAPSAEPEADDTPTRVRDPWLIGAAAALALTAVIPWRSSYSFGDDTLPQAASLAFLWDYSAEDSWLSVGLLVLLTGAAAIASVYVERIRPYRRIIGWVAVALSAVFIIQSFRMINDWNGDLVESLIDIFSSDFAIGPWVALVAGGILARKS
jgi:hypothetical protein